MKTLFTTLISLTIFGNLFAQHNMGAGDLNSCSTTLRDIGGAANYTDNLDVIETYCSDAGNCISVNFTSFSTENIYDYLNIYDGSSTSDPLIGQYMGTTSPGTISSSTGCLTFEFHSDINTNSTGWEATISCVACPTCDPPTTLGTSSVGGVDALLSWTESGAATTWDIEWGATGFAPTGTPTENDVTTNPYYLAGLATTTTYDYYVRADCGGLLSSWSGPFTFTTTTLPPGSNCGDPYVLSLPFSADYMSTAGFGDNYNDVSLCTTSGYLEGNDYVMEYTPAVDECITLNLHNMSHSYGSLFLLDGCPDNASTNCLATNRGGFVQPTDGFTDVSLTGGNTYYIVVSSDPFGGQTLVFDLDITGGACPTCFDGIRNGDEENIDCGGSCPNTCSGSTCLDAFEITSLPYRSQNNTTDNMGDSYDASDACGSTYMTGNDFVYKYTATAADTCITIALEELSRFASGVFLLDDCPDAVGATCIASAVENTSDPKSSLYIYNQQLVAGQEYYIVVSTNGSNSQSTDFNFNMVNYCGAPDCGSNQAADDLCGSATYLSNFDGFCGNTSSTYTVSTNEPSVFCASIENNSWFSFTADSTSAVIDVYVENCIGGRGIQIEMYETSDCINFNSVSNCWNPGIEINGSVTASGLTVGNIYYIMVDGFAGDVCDYTIQVVEGIDIPLNMSSINNFDVQCTGSQSTLTWSVNASAIDHDMVIEKSVNGKDFMEIDRLRNSINNHFQYVDKSTNGEKSYYRVRQENTHGQSTTTKTLSTNCSGSFADVTIFPNPAKNQIHIMGENITDVEVVLLNSVGQTVKPSIHSLDGNLILDVTELPRSVYIIGISNESNRFFEKVILD